MEKKKFLQKFSVADLILIAMLAAITIAVKAVAGILVRMITGPLGIPGGALAGGLYMLWMGLGIAVVGRRGVALLISIVQTIVLIISGIPGGHGIWSILTYLAPAVAVELVFLIKKSDYNALHFVIATLLANMIGTIGSNLLFFRLSIIPLLFTVASAAFSGAIGGFIGYVIYLRVKKTGLLRQNSILLNEKMYAEDDHEKNSP